MDRATAFSFRHVSGCERIDGWPMERGWYIIHCVHPQLQAPFDARSTCACLTLSHSFKTWDTVCVNT